MNRKKSYSKQHKYLQQIMQERDPHTEAGCGRICHAMHSPLSTLIQKKKVRNKKVLNKEDGLEIEEGQEAGACTKFIHLSFIQLLLELSDSTIKLVLLVPREAGGEIGGGGRYNPKTLG